MQTEPGIKVEASACAWCAKGEATERRPVVGGRPSVKVCAGCAVKIDAAWEQQFSDKRGDDSLKSPAARYTARQNFATKNGLPFSWVNRESSKR